MTPLVSHGPVAGYDNVWLHPIVREILLHAPEYGTLRIKVVAGRPQREAEKGTTILVGKGPKEDDGR